MVKCDGCEEEKVVLTKYAVMDGNVYLCKDCEQTVVNRIVMSSLYGKGGHHEKPIN